MTDGSSPRERASPVTRWLWVWGPAAGQMALIFAISSLHQAPLPEGMTDHEGHSIGYAILSVLIFRALAGASWSGLTMLRGVMAVIYATLYGLTDEFHQVFVAGRTAAWDDVAADLRGAAIGVVVVAILYTINRLWRTRT